MKIRISQIQSHVYDDKKRNLEVLHENLKALSSSKPDFVTLGEMFNCPYITSNFPVYAEEQGGETWQTLSGYAREFSIYLSAGSIPTRDAEGHVYNTAYVFDREGKQIAKHSKAHMFDIDVRGGQSYRESDTLTPGEKYTVFDTEFGKMGLCVCFDCRFPELVRLMVLDGAKAVFVPAAFNMTTGPAHWDIMFRCRALDNQCYMIGTSPARDEDSGYIAWGHSLIASPWGDLVHEMDEKEGVVTTDIDLDYVDDIRQQLPLLSSRRTDIYNVNGK